MKRVLISVEGQTEETFVNNILFPYLSQRDIFVTPIIVSTKRVKNGTKFKGGISNYNKVKNEITNLTKDTNISAITTMYDYYRIPTNFPGYDTKPNGNCYQIVSYLEEKFVEDISDSRFKPYFQIHEYEALLFVEPSKLANLFPNSNKLIELIRIKQLFNSPEEINNGEQTAPSKRLLLLYPEYEKPLFGVLALLDTNLQDIRNQCNHFNEWVTWLENL